MSFESLSLLKSFGICSLVQAKCELFINIIWCCPCIAFCIFDAVTKVMSIKPVVIFFVIHNSSFILVANDFECFDL